MSYPIAPAKNPLTRRVFAVAALAVLSACSSGQSDATASAAGSEPETPAETTREPSIVDQCALMPMADVSAILQAHGVDAVNTIEPGAGGMCAYRRELEPRGYSTKLLIDFTRFPTVDKAREQEQAMREEYQVRHMATQPVPGLGDEAVLSTNEGAATVRIRVGAFTGKVTLRMGERDPASLQPAVLALGREVVKRLPAK